MQSLREVSAKGAALYGEAAALFLTQFFAAFSFLFHHAASPSR